MAEMTLIILALPLPGQNVDLDGHLRNFFLDLKNAGFAARVVLPWPPSSLEFWRGFAADPTNCVHSIFPSTEMELESLAPWYWRYYRQREKPKLRDLPFPTAWWVYEVFSLGVPHESTGDRPVTLVWPVHYSMQERSWELDELLDLQARFAHRFEPRLITVAVQMSPVDGPFLRTFRGETIEYPAERNQLISFLRTLSKAQGPTRTRASSSPSRGPTIFPQLLAGVGGLLVSPFLLISPLPRPSQKQPPQDVYLGISTPPVVAKLEKFVARFTAYSKARRSEVARALASEAPTSKQSLDLDRCRWLVGTHVTVRLQGDGASVEYPEQSFEWDGDSKMLRFDVKVEADISTGRLILRFDIFVEGLPIVSLRPEIEVSEGRSLSKERAPDGPTLVLEQQAPKSAFASYAKKDRREVVGRVRSLQIFTGIDVFLDCLSLRPGEEWKPKLLSEIASRDIFWLFWSQNAMNSTWVDWEWRAALEHKTLKGIQPHPLEPVETAPPPTELCDLQFGALYEAYLTSLPRSRYSLLLTDIKTKTRLALAASIRFCKAWSIWLLRLVPGLAMLGGLGWLIWRLAAWIWG
jgi:hypothetical protein